MSLETRTATEADVRPFAEVLDLPEAAAIRLVLTRSVEIGIEGDEVTRCLAYDVHGGVVEVTRIAGTAETIRHLLDVPQSVRPSRRPSHRGAGSRRSP